MIALISLFVIIIVSIVVVRVGAIALELTGIPSEIAAFQAQSAFSGTGFTTAEAEVIVNHPARRKIIRLLIMLGSAGLTSSIATLIVAFVGQENDVIANRGGWLAAGLLAVFLFARSKFIHKVLKRLITNMLRRHTSLAVMDYNEILGLGKGYGISTFQVKEDSWLVGKPLKSLHVRREGVLILTIKRKIGGKEETIGAPTADVEIKAGDALVCYGKAEAIRNLSERLKGAEGDLEHDRVVDIERGTAKAEEATIKFEEKRESASGKRGAEKKRGKRGDEGGSA